MKKICLISFSIMCYSTFLIAGTALMAFFINVGPWRIIDQGEIVFAPWLLNAFWVMLFAVHHSVMARPFIKEAIAKLLPAYAERSFYVLVSSSCLLLLMWQWQPIQGVVWQFESGAMIYAMYALYGFGWFLVFASTFSIDHWHLFGIKQAWYAFEKIATQATESQFVTPFLYRIVRHPMMLGMVFVLWSTPSMSIGHAYLAGLLSLYIYIGLKYEEKDLLKELGEQYAEYQKRIPKLIPFFKS